MAFELDDNLQNETSQCQHIHKISILDLSTKDIDFENNIIHIRNGVVRENVFTADGKKVETYQIVLGPLKTHKSKRDIPINDITASLL